MKTELEIRRAKNAYEKLLRNEDYSGSEYSSAINSAVVQALGWVLDEVVDSYTDEIIDKYIKGKL